MKHSRINRLAIYIALSGWTFVCLLPVLWIALASIKAPLTAVILATRILPPAVLALPLYFMAQFVGMLDTRTALAFT
jgi:ABC-type glycerol-3-phosphate transport system permease component